MYLPTHTHVKVNFKQSFTGFNIGVFILLDWAPFDMNKSACPTIYLELKGT